MYQSADKAARRLIDMDNGMKLARAARDRGDQKLAWQHVIDYNLDEFSVQELGLAEKYRPKQLRGRAFPKAMGCV